MLIRKGEFSLNPMKTNLQFDHLVVPWTSVVYVAGCPQPQSAGMADSYRPTQDSLRDQAPVWGQMHGC